MSNVKDKFEYPVYSLDGKSRQSVNLIFKYKNKMGAIHKVFLHEKKNNSQYSACSKRRNQVSGGGKKPWRQKGTGRARAGSIRSPLWKGGGVIFGPKPIPYTGKINRKERRAALSALMYNRRENLRVVEALERNFSLPRTKELLSILNNWHIDINEKVLLVVKEKQTNLYLASRNLPNIEVVRADQVNITQLLSNQKIIIDKEALNLLERVVDYEE